MLKNKRILFCIFQFLIFIYHVYSNEKNLTAIIESESSVLNTENRIRDRAYILRPIDFFTIYRCDPILFVIEGQQILLGEKLLGKTIGIISFPSEKSVIGLALGLQYNLTGEYLDGLLISVLPQFIIKSDSIGAQFGCYVESVIQKVENNGYTYGAYIGSFISQQPYLSIGMLLGYSFWNPYEEPKYKVE